MNSWEKFKILSAVLVPAAIALVGHWYTSAISEREIQAKFVELGVSILQAAPNSQVPGSPFTGIWVPNWKEP